MLNRLQRKLRAPDGARRYANSQPHSVRIAPAHQWDELQPKDQLYRCSTCRQPTLPFADSCYGEKCLLQLLAEQDGHTLGEWCRRCWRRKDDDGGYLCGDPVCFAEFITLFQVTRLGADSIKWEGEVDQDEEEDG